MVVGVFVFGFMFEIMDVGKGRESALRNLVLSNLCLSYFVIDRVQQDICRKALSKQKHCCTNKNKHKMMSS